MERAEDGVMDSFLGCPWGMPREVGSESVVMQKAKQHLRFDLKHRS